MTVEIDDIDLSKHAVIEASAGTGKTYTIEHLVLRLLLEKKVKLDKILLVTFTEKATGELKGRLRKTLEEKLAAKPELRPLLQEALDNFDQAPIFTIHGFCQRLLAEYALEQGQDLRRELVNDYDLVEPALREVQRRVWTQEFGPRLEEVLQLAAYTSDAAPKWDDKVKNLAAKYRKEFGHELMPETRAKDFDLNTRDEECRALVYELRALAGPIEEEVEKHPWYMNLKSVQCHGTRRKKKLERYLVPFMRWLRDAPKYERSFASFLELRDSIKDAYDDVFPNHGFRSVYEKPEGFESALAAACPDLVRAIGLLQDYNEKRCRCQFATHLAVRTIEETREHLDAVKAERGLCSFDDMIIDVAKAVEGADKQTEHFLDQVRHRFAYAIVDEFQDTDPLQWRIFERIFLDGGQSRLIVVGDPKQAIYSFRGADLPTYVRAVKTMKQPHAATRWPLTTNWRTTSELLEPLNCLFENSGWFGPESAMPFERAVPPLDKSQQTIIHADTSDRKPFTVVDLREMDSLARAHKRYARFAVEEIQRLLAAGIQFAKRGEPRSLTYADICILVFTRSKAKAIVEEMDRARIPYTFYKQPGLWTSTEAEHLGVLLKALAAPDDRSAFRKALLTMFFGRTPAELAASGDVPSIHPARDLFAHWLSLTSRREWSALFQSLLEETGVLLRGGEDSDRRIANLRHLAGALEEAAYRTNLDIVDVVEEYERLRKRGDDSQGDVEPINTQQPKVKIMTIHAAKGLEFPVVFVAGGFTKSAQLPRNHYHRVDGTHVFDLEPDSNAKTTMSNEDAEENHRLLYVALTRAMIKLYVPLVSIPETRAATAGPVATLLAKALETAMAKEPANMAVVKPHLEKRRVSMPVPTLETPEKKARSLKELFPAHDPNLSKRRLLVRSFSSLHRAARLAHFGEETPKADDEGPERPDDPLRGLVFGELVHVVLETIDFAAVAGAADVSALVQKGSPLRAVLEGPVDRHLPRLRGRQPLEQLREACLAKVAELVWNALRRPLPALGGCLGALPADDRVHELEFLFPERHGQAPPAEVRLEDGFLTGFMDLVFRKDGLYFLLDWKTNDLDGYDAPAIGRAMADSDYHRQYRLYLHALERWLARRHGADFDFLGRCGGVYYLFLRGMTGDDPAAGVFFHRPTAADLRLDLALGGA